MGTRRSNSFRLPGHPASVGLARRQVRDHLAGWGHGPDHPVPADAVLLVSELATIAVRHGPRPEREFEVTVTVLADGSCLIEVSDEGHHLSRLRASDETNETDETVRGLQIVEHVAAAWGVWGRGGHGPTVWAVARAGT
ncbi:ATP-binding protein [Streptomyces brasiliensis]|uniref:Histidine kinase/HSP90-like ATPase domain-containing protein n=1 Tax=Streptomyces brasiliensis TaxID=1954 RepID=A0A917NQQ1_9ACTN|nr:ATP-binding protein [Streptomyces brasiliensis]GGJ20615.1 hypothetical protein GCM10010121_034510 [Streptomyces brasiliensis]